MGSGINSIVRVRYYGKWHLQHVRLRLRGAEVDALREGGEVALARLRGRRQRRQLLRLGRYGGDIGEM